MAMYCFAEFVPSTVVLESTVTLVFINCILPYDPESRSDSVLSFSVRSNPFIT